MGVTAVMGAKRYRGPVETVEQAMMANRVLHIICQRRSRSSTMWAYKLQEKVALVDGIVMLTLADSGWSLSGP